jgi:uncharacterized protein (DUF1697 family)
VARYVAFLRGINLGSTNKISMPELREMASELGYSNVATYINSGNLIFGSTKKVATLEREIAEAITKRFGTKTDVAVRTPAQLRKVLADNPFPDGAPTYVTVAFLTKAAPADAKRKVAEVATEKEPYVFAGQEVYVHYTQGQGRSKLSAKFSDILGVSATVRNLRTVTKVLELAQDS